MLLATLVVLSVLSGLIIVALSSYRYCRRQRRWHGNGSAVTNPFPINLKTRSVSADPVPARGESQAAIPLWSRAAELPPSGRASGLVISAHNGLDEIAERRIKMGPQPSHVIAPQTVVIIAPTPAILIEPVAPSNVPIITPSQANAVAQEKVYPSAHTIVRPNVHRISPLVVPVVTRTIEPTIPTVVESPGRSAWDEKGWTRQQNTYEGNYQVFEHKSRRIRRFNGRIVLSGEVAQTFIADPPPEIKRHPKGPCFQLHDGGMFKVEWRRPARNVDEAILYVERVLDESLNS
jgi:hypothetical protein